MRFEGAVFKPTGNEPKEMDSFFNHYALVNRFLQTFNTQKLTVVDNVASYSVEQELFHGSEISIPHPLRYPPRTVQYNGRIEFLQVIYATVERVRVKPKLLTVQILEPTPGRAQSRIAVSDTTFFRLSDSVRIGNTILKLKGIDGNILVLSGNVVYDSTIKTVSLASEVASLFIF